jgi:hypothetical protein
MEGDRASKKRRIKMTPEKLAIDSLEKYLDYRNAGQFAIAHSILALSKSINKISGPISSIPEKDIKAIAVEILKLPGI